MSKEFKSAVMTQLIYPDRTFFYVGDVILLRLPDWANWTTHPTWRDDIISNVTLKALNSVIRDRQGVPLNPITIDRQGPATEAEYEALLDRAADCDVARQFVILPGDGK